MAQFQTERPSDGLVAARRENNRGGFVMSLLLESLEPRRAPRPRTSRPPVFRRSRNRRLFLESFEKRVLPTFSLGAAANYAILFEGGETNDALEISNSTLNVTGSGPSQGGGIGNIGVGNVGQSTVGGPSVINGRIDFSAANRGQFSNNNIFNVITGGVNYNVSAVTSALTTVNALNTTLGALPGPSPTINGNTTINAINGNFSASGPGYTNVRVFDINAFNLNNGQTLTINGDSNGDSVVFNFGGSTNFNGNVVLTGGLTPDNVLFNFVGGNLSGGGPTLNLNTGSGFSNLAQGIFLDPDGQVTVNNANVFGRVFGGDSRDFQFSGTSDLTAPIITASPTLTTTPSPTTVRLGNNDVTLTDSATLSGGNSPTGTITFRLFQNGTTQVDTESVAVHGNGTYATPTGFTLPATGTVTGTYQWNASYSGDGSNNPANDNNAANEQVTVSPANPTVVTTASAAITFNARIPTIGDSAVLAGSYFATGTISFTLALGPTQVYSTSVVVAGNGIYSASYTLPTTGTVAGTYTWTAHYSGDINNNPADDQGGAAEKTVVSKASPTVVTTASPDITLGTTPPTISDSAVLAGSFFATGTISFTLDLGATQVYSTSDPVSGSGTYSASYTLPTTGTVTGTYTWMVHYSGDGNNNAADDQGGTAEQTVVSASSPTLSTTPSPASVTLITTAPTLKDSATLAAEFNPTGTITFTLYYNGGSTPVHTETVTVTGNGTYTTPTGYTLPTTGTVTGTYQWDASYSGDGNNSPVSDNNSTNEQVTVSAASPTVVTTASPASVTLGTTAPTISDSAVLAGSYFATGTISFTLDLGGTQVYSTSAPVSGSGTYSASYTLPTTGTVTGTYTWTARYSGDSNNNADVDQGGTAEQTDVSAANPTVVTTASPAITFRTTAPIISDSAVLAGGYFPTGAISFTLDLGATQVYSASELVSGNDTYSASYTLPTTGAVTGTYVWTVHYSGDSNNKPADDQGGTAEQTVVSAANPTVVTAASPAITLGTTAPTITDSAVFAGGYFPTGTITFTLDLGATQVYSTSEPVAGNGTYNIGYTVPTTGTVTGTYTWAAHYSGDSNNNAADDQGGAAEQTVVSPASPAVVTTASPAITLGTTAPTIGDLAVLAGGYFATGTISFTLDLGATQVYSTSDTVAGNGTYSASYTLPTTGAVTGTYTWLSHYSGDSNNNAADDQRGTAEGTVVSAASPTLSTIPSPTSITLSNATPPVLTDSATLAGGFSPTGSIIFTLFHNGGTTPVDTETVTVSGNGTYTTPTGYKLPTTGNVTGTYQWDATYNGDTNNNAASDTGAANEQVTVSAANPTITTTPTPATVTLGPTPVPLKDTATLAAGFDPTGTITFTLFKCGDTTPVNTETVEVNGNGTYTTPIGFTLPTTGTVTGTYQWDATYSGDTNNAVASDTSAANEQVTVSRGQSDAHHDPQPDHSHAGRVAPTDPYRFGDARRRL